MAMIPPNWKPFAVWQVPFLMSRCALFRGEYRGLRNDGFVRVGRAINCYLKGCRGEVSPPDNEDKIFCSQRERSHFEGTNTPSKGFLLTFCPRRQKVTKNAFGERVNAEVGTLCVPTSIACQRYRIPDSPHLRHGRPPRCSLVAFHRPNWTNHGQKEGREAFLSVLPKG